MSGLLHEAIEVFGLESRAPKAREECLECALAITHFLDGKVTLDELADEIIGAQMTLIMLKAAINRPDVFGAAKRRQFAKLDQAIDDHCENRMRNIMLNGNEGLHYPEAAE